jgi:hypothetical protein
MIAKQPSQSTVKNPTLFALLLVAPIGLCRPFRPFPIIQLLFRGLRFRSPPAVIIPALQA